MIEIAYITNLPSGRVLLEGRGEAGEVYFGSGRTIWAAISKALSR